VSLSTEKKRRWRVEYKERQQGMTVPGFGPISFGHVATVEAADAEEARQRAREHQADPETMVPADARIVKLEQISRWRVTLRGKKDARRRESFIVSAATEREALSNVSFLPAAMRFARDPRFNSKNRPPSLIKIEQLSEETR
jgi:1,2-phenylacetyl-CoA epoxidase PaaB subunit